MKPIRLPRMKVWNQFVDYKSATWFWKLEKLIGNVNNNKQNKQCVDMWNRVGRYIFFFFPFSFDPSSNMHKHFIFENNLFSFFKVLKKAKN